jgi:catechol 2,3-dioxygenase-like lactoylglutathione lyase family enzyme
VFIWRFNDIHHTGLTVTDIRRSIEFYRDVLGLTLVRLREISADYVSEQTGFPGVRLAAASFNTGEQGKQSIEIVQYRSHTGEPVQPATNRAGVAHLCLLVSDLREAYNDLLARGVTFRSEPVLITEGPNQVGYVVYLHDTDSFRLEMFQPPAQQPK